MAVALLLQQSYSEVNNYMFSVLHKLSLLLFHQRPFFRFVLATPFLIWFHVPQKHGSHGHQHPPQPRLPHSSDPMFPGLGHECCLSSLSSGFKLLRSKVQQVLSSLVLLTHLFVPKTCQVFSSPTKPMGRYSALFRASLTCANTNRAAALEGEQRAGVSEGSWNSVWSLQVTIKECCPLMQKNWVPATQQPCYSSSAACRKGLLELARSIWW